MTRITNMDQMLLLLRTQLQRMETAPKLISASPPRRPEGAQKKPLSRIRDLAKSGQLSDTEIGKALIQGILSERLGAAIANDPSFNAITEDIAQIIREDDDTQGLMDRVVHHLKSA